MITRVRNQVVIGLVTAVLLLTAAGLLHTGIQVLTNVPLL